jgi:hypothetical protein
VGAAMTHLQLSGDLLDFGLAHMLEKVEPPQEAELVAHADQSNVRRRRHRLHRSSSIEPGFDLNRDPRHKATDEARNVTGVTKELRLNGAGYST